MPIIRIDENLKETNDNHVAYGIALEAGLVPRRPETAVKRQSEGFEKLEGNERYFITHKFAETVTLGGDESKSGDRQKRAGQIPILQVVERIGLRYGQYGDESPEIHVLLEVPKGMYETYQSALKFAQAVNNPKLFIYVMDEKEGFADNIVRRPLLRKFLLNSSQEALAIPPLVIPSEMDEEKSSELSPSSVTRFYEGLVATVKNHWFRIVAPTVFLGLFLLFPIPVGLNSLWPAATAWLLGNVLTVVLIPTITFAVGYLLFQLSQQFSDEDKGDDDWNKYHALHNLGRFLMWSSVGFGLFAALFTPAIPAFLQAAVIGNGINSGFVTQLFSFDVLGLLPLLGIVALAGALGIFLTKWTPSAFNGLKEKDNEYWKANAIYCASKLGVFLVYASAFTVIFLSVASLSMAITMAAGGSAALGLGIGFMLTVGPVIAKVAAQVGKLTGWIGAYAEMIANFIGTLKLPAIHFASGIRALFNSKVGAPWHQLREARRTDEASGEDKSADAVAAKIKVAEAKAITAKQEEYTNQILQHGPESKAGKVLQWTYDLVAGIFIVAFRAVSVALSEVNQMFEVLEGKLPPAKEITNDDDDDKYDQTIDNYDPILAEKLSYEGDPAKVGHPFDPPLWCWDSQIATAAFDVFTRGQLATAYTDETDRVLNGDNGVRIATLPAVGAG